MKPDKSLERRARSIAVRLFPPHSPRQDAIAKAVASTSRRAYKRGWNEAIEKAANAVNCNEDKKNCSPCKAIEERILALRRKK